MRFRNFLETSITVSFLKSLKYKITAIYHESEISHLINRTNEILQLSYRFSIFKASAEIIEIKKPVILYNSRFTQLIVNLYEKLQKGMIDYLSTSPMRNWAVNIKKEISLYSLKAVSIILILAIIVNLILSLIFLRELEIIKLIIAGILLMVGVLGILCDIDWATIKSGSFILRILFR